MQTAKSNLAVLVVAYNRPGYLFVVLSALFRCRGISKYPVYIFVDGGGAMEHELRDVCSQFSVAGIIFRDRRLDCVQHYTRSIYGLMCFGYDEVLYITDDLLLRSDSIEYIERVPRDAVFMTLTHPDGKEQCHEGYSSYGNLVCQSSFAPLYDYVVREEYVGIEHFHTGVALRYTAGEDWVYSQYLHDRGLLTRTPAIFYACHFGAYGRNLRNRRDSCDDVESEIFSGPSSQWLENTIKLLRRDYSKHPELAKRLRPTPFAYA